ncbi:hypothetical protein [Streptomyces sp. NPDC088757]|uniref:hypothetical protein n=1 Tax=Streptomyces sp. NPDC088757 TaxID=3365889 RepID=UPI0038211205
MARRSRAPSAPPARRAGRVLIFVGEISLRGFNEGGQGYAELVLPDVDPQQRRLLERAGRYRFELYLDSGQLYCSPPLILHAAKRNGDGALVVIGCP